jgi:FtsH-binding integral membrane protein
MLVAIVLFAIAAVGGVVMAAMRFRGRVTLPLGLALVHGGVAAAGLVALIWAVVGGLSAKTPLVLFLIAALGGFFLFSFQLRKKAIPVGAMVVHALVAVIAFVLLLLKV